MGKILIIKGADFSAVAVDNVQSTWANNTYTWDKGGIAEWGKTSGSTNYAMSMVNPCPQATSAITLKPSNGYRIYGVAISSDNINIESYIEYKNREDAPSEVTIDAGKYFQIAISTISGDNADITQGAQSLLINELKVADFEN